nr:MAG TPA: hypothetical protein [Caudoviricetes sp.]
MPCDATIKLTITVTSRASMPKQKWTGQIRKTELL